MSAYTDGYNPNQVNATVQAYDDMASPAVAITVEISVTVDSGHVTESDEVLVAAATAAKDYLETAFPGVVYPVHKTLSGSKDLGTI